uniref:Uncharacterized protein n=1 Tax=Oryza rufipogon TaxID=4529 RepID=A0A0E0Q6R7_ORYRU
MRAGGGGGVVTTEFVSRWRRAAGAQSAPVEMRAGSGVGGAKCLGGARVDLVEKPQPLSTSVSVTAYAYLAIVGAAPLPTSSPPTSPPFPDCLPVRSGRHRGHSRRIWTPQLL